MKQESFKRGEQIAGFGFWELFLDENREYQAKPTFFHCCTTARDAG